MHEPSRGPGGSPLVGAGRGSARAQICHIARSSVEVVIPGGLSRLMKLRSDKELGAVSCPCPTCNGICEQIDPVMFDRAAHSLCFDGWTQVDMKPPQKDTLYHCRMCEAIFSEVVWDHNTGSGPYFWVRSRWHTAATGEPGFWSFEGRGLEDDPTPQ